GEMMYKTGDLGRWLPNGDIEFLGRKDSQVKIRGYRIELGEIENALSNHPDVEAAAVTAITGRQGENELAAYLTGRTSLNAAALRTFLKNTLPAHMIPEHFVQLDSLPLTSNGKVDRNALPAPVGLAMSTGIAYVAPRNRTEEKLAAVWKEVLGRDRISIKDNFFDLGGNSIKIIRMVEAVNRTLGEKLSVVMAFKYPNISELAGFLSERLPLEAELPDEETETDVSTMDETLQILSQGDKR
ncbi:MAG TPA: phosphopantetheine-binding protein, partial [Flavisolibacter sp.]